MTRSTAELIDKLSELFNELKLEVQAVVERAKATEDRGKNMEEKIEELYKVVVVGNGRPSLRAQVARHDDWINSANKLIWIIVAALIGQLCATSFGVIVWIIVTYTEWKAKMP